MLSRCFRHGGFCSVVFDFFTDASAQLLCLCCLSCLVLCHGLFQFYFLNIVFVSHFSFCFCTSIGPLKILLKYNYKVFVFLSFPLAVKCTLNIDGYVSYCLLFRIKSLLFKVACWILPHLRPKPPSQSSSPQIPRKFNLKEVCDDVASQSEFLFVRSDANRTCTVQLPKA